MGGVSSIVVLVSKFIECFPRMASKFFFKITLIFHWLHLLLVKPYISSSTFVVSVHINSYINFFSSSFFVTFPSAGVVTSISIYISSFLFLVTTSGLFAATSLSVCSP